MSQRILITGGAGYLGSQVLRDLARTPHAADLTLRIYDNLSHKRLDGLRDLPVGPRYEFIEGDVLDRLNLERAMAGITHVLHLAGRVSTPYSYHNAESMHQVNAYGTAVVAEAAHAAGVRRLVFSSSAAVYGHGGPFREEHPLKPMAPYAASLVAAERELLAVAKRGLPIAILRLGSVFGSGPGMGFDDVINRLTYFVGVRKPLLIHGDGEQIRPYIHLRDAAALLIRCLSAELPEGPVLNAVTLNPSIHAIVACLQELVPGTQVRYTEQDILNRISFQVESQRLTRLGFQPQFDLRQGLAELISHWPPFAQPDLFPSYPDEVES